MIRPYLDLFIHNTVPVCVTHRQNYHAWALQSAAQQYLWGSTLKIEIGKLGSWKCLQTSFSRGCLLAKIFYKKR